MAGKTKAIELPVTKSGYRFQSEAEYREAKWLVKEGVYASLDEFGKASEKVDEKFRKMLAREKKRA